MVCKRLCLFIEVNIHFLYVHVRYNIELFYVLNTFTWLVDAWLCSKTFLDAGEKFKAHILSCIILFKIQYRYYTKTKRGCLEILLNSFEIYKYYFKKPYYLLIYHGQLKRNPYISLYSIKSFHFIFR